MKTEFLLFFLSFFLCCVYSSNPGVIPSHLVSVAIPVFVNNTLEPLLEENLTKSVVYVFQKDNTLQVRTEDQATSILKGEIIEYKKDIYSWDESERVKEYKLTLQVKITFFDLVENKERVKDKIISESVIYPIIDSDGNQLDDEQEENNNKIILIERISQEILNSIFGDW